MLQRIQAVPQEQRWAVFGCFGSRGAETQELSCYREHEGVVSLWPSLTAPDEEGNAVQYVNSFLVFLTENLPAHAFRGVSAPQIPGELSAIQLLDGVAFTAENFQEATLPAETRISVASLKTLVRSQIPEHH